MPQHDANSTNPSHTSSSHFVADDHGEEPGAFDGIADWPDLDRYFHEESLSILKDEGISAWFEAGGRQGQDGRFTFDGLSRRGKAICRGLLQSGPGCIWTSPCGDTWAVRPTGDDRRSPSLAYAVTYQCDHKTLDLNCQRPIRNAIEGRLRYLRQVRPPWGHDDHVEFVRLSQYRRRLVAIDSAVRLFPYLRYRNRHEKQRTFIVAADEAAYWLADDATDCNTFMLGEALEAAAQISLAEFRVGTLHLGIKLVDRTTAVTRFRQDRDEYRVTVSPLFRKVINAFASVVDREDRP